MNGIPNVPPYLPTNQTSSFQQGISTLIAPSQPSTFNQNVQPMPQQLPPTMPQSLQQPLPQTGNYLYMDNLPVSNPAVVQSATLMNSQMMGLVGVGLFESLYSINRHSYIAFFFKRLFVIIIFWENESSLFGVCSTAFDSNQLY